MSLDKLQSLGFTVTHSGPTYMKTWGKWVVHVSGPGRMVNGYGDDEASAILDALITIESPH